MLLHGATTIIILVVSQSCLKIVKGYGIVLKAIISIISLTKTRVIAAAVLDCSQIVQVYYKLVTQCPHCI